MTYQDDPNINRRRRMDDGRGSYTAWIVGGILALGLIAGIFMVFGRNDTNTAENSRPTTTTSQPTTTGAATSVPAPNSGNGTAGNAQQTNPPTPAPRPSNAPR
jgi:hypothetical protein